MNSIAEIFYLTLEILQSITNNIVGSKKFDYDEV